ncbi:MAG: putative prokaryotic signal transducing protein [Candidatus Binatota bacterium]|nr:putative prokaryotic signal transducing protein [Candidatus Binatota bacterium]
MDLETVHQTFDPVEAHALKEQLDAAGIPCSLINEASSSMFGPNPDTTIRLVVPEGEVEAAKKVIAEFLKDIAEPSETK